MLGVIGFVTGFVLVWFIYDYKQNLGFSIGITYGGICQMQLEFAGYKSIRCYKNIKAQIRAGEYKKREELMLLQDKRDEQLTIHIQSMINLFVLACGIPALIRICDAFGYIYLPLLLLVAYGLSYCMARPYLKRIKDKRTSERNNANDSTSLLKHENAAKN